VLQLWRAGGESLVIGHLNVTVCAIKKDRVILRVQSTNQSLAIERSSHGVVEIRYDCCEADEDTTSNAPPPSNP
jgi:hypothetical protein